MAKTNKTRKVDYKGIAKNSVLEIVRSTFASAGLEVAEGADYGFKANTLVIRGVDAEGTAVDVKLELSAPKAGFMNYDHKLEEMADAE